ncbi:hypothetical protein C8Q74DRAFT_1367187 [Fomes fomentarius]|nr:hypothetical protein C8Q74DRAFT_1367187 [Fomes fomentarius]
MSSPRSPVTSPWTPMASPRTPPNDLEEQFPQARLEVKQSLQRRHSGTEKRLKKIDDAFTRTASPLGALIHSDDAAAAFSAVKEQVRNFAERTDVLMAVLDQVADLHPFIGVAVKIFKAAVTLERIRRENDEKVITLNLAMCDMMDVLAGLKSLVEVDIKKLDPQTGTSIESRMKSRMSAIIGSIRQCAKLCDSYQKRHLAIKYLTSFKWKNKFTEVAQDLLDHKANLQFDLQIHASVGIAKTNSTLSIVASDVTEMKDNMAKVMDAVFTRMQSPDERELSSFVTTRLGGVDAVLKDDALLTQLIEKQKSMGDAKGDTASKKSGEQGGSLLTIAELRREIGQDVDQVVAQNRFFEQKLDATLAQINEIKTSVEKNADRVIKAYQNGPHDQINDPVLRHIWKYHGWKGNVKATHLVMALRDHFAQGSHSALALICEKARKDNPDPPAQIVKEVADIAAHAEMETTDEDRWAMQYITVLRVQPLIEAFDDDVSSFVTIAEVNAFTAACPPTWSLPHWIAYWTYGFEMSQEWYFRRIRKSVSNICAATRVALPANRRILNEFIDSFEMQFVEDLLSGLRGFEQWDYTDWDSDVTFLKFKDYILDNETRMEKTLKRLKYYIDDTNTLTLVVGAGRPEKFLLPLIFLLLRRTFSIVAQAGDSTTLHPKELHIVRHSIDTLRRVVSDRIRTLQAVYKLRNLNQREQLEKFFGGLYAYVSTSPQVNSYWMRSPDIDAIYLHQSSHHHLYDPKDPENQGVHVPLFYGIQPEVPHLDIGVGSGGAVPRDLHSRSMPKALTDPSKELARMTWRLYLRLDDDTITGRYEGHLDRYGRATSITGVWVSECDGIESLRPSDESDEAFFTPINSPLIPSSFVVSVNDSELNSRHDLGDAGNGGLSSDASKSATLADEEPVPMEFTLSRRMAEHPSAEALKKNRWKALWEIALNSALRAARGGKFDWRTLYYRSPQRQRYIELLRENRWQSEPELAQEWIALIQTVHEEVLRLWFEFAIPKLLPDSMYRRDIVHGYGHFSTTIMKDALTK